MVSVILLIATTCVAIGIGVGVVVSKRKFNANISDAESNITEIVAPDESLSDEIDRLEQLKRNLVTVKRNINSLDIPIPENLASYDDTESSLNKLSKFFEEHSKLTVGTEAFILSILPVSQTGEALQSFASIAPDLVSDAFSNSLAALKEGMVVPGIDNLDVCLTKFCEGMAHTSHLAVAKSLMHHDYMGALLKPIKSGLIEMTGLHDATNSLTESFHNIDMDELVSNFSNCVDNNINPTDFTDLDFSGHIPVVTIAISSFREFKLLMDNKTNTMTSLKNIGLDAAGAGGGGLVGAKTGAIVGSFFGPVGTFIGGIVGGIGGAMGGRAITNEIKQKPLRNAIQAYQSNAELMKTETKEKSRNMLLNITSYTTEKRNAFKNDNLLKDIPLVESNDTILGITLIMYQAIIDHLSSMKQKVEKMKSSFWFTEGKYGAIVTNYENRIIGIERLLPLPEKIKANPKLALKSLMALEIPTQKAETSYRDKYIECSNELKEMNDKNNASVLVWSYMVNGFYKKTLNEIANYSNTQMNDFNQFVDQWKQTMYSLESKVNVEKGKLGLK